MLILYFEHVSILYISRLYKLHHDGKSKIYSNRQSKTRIESKSTNLMTLDGLFSCYPLENRWKILPSTNQIPRLLEAYLIICLKVKTKGVQVKYIHTKICPKVVSHIINILAQIHGKGWILLHLVNYVSWSLCLV